MAIQNFVEGALYGKVGAFVGANWRGIDYMRSYAKPKQPDTPAQLQHKAEFRQLITIANNLHSIWFPYVFSEIKNKTLSNQFMTLNKGYYSSHDTEDLFILPYTKTHAIDGITSVKRTATSATCKITAWNDSSLGSFQRALFGYYFPDDNELYFKVSENCPDTASFQLVGNRLQHRFFIFAQWIYENYTSQVVRGATRYWSVLN